VAHGDAVALWREGEAAHGRGRLKSLRRSLLVARRHKPPGRPDRRARSADGDRVDPCAGRAAQLRRLPIGAKLHHAAIIAAGDEATAIARRRQNAALRMNDDAALLPDLGNQHRAVSAGENGRAPEPAAGRDMGSGGNGGDAIGQIGERRR
jgi:hypothetical protein